MKSRHEPVPQPKGQSASRPERLLTQPCPDCFSRPPASRSSSLGRGVGLVFLWCAPSFSSLFFRFSVLVSRELSRSRGCVVATPAIRGVSRGGCAAWLLVAVRFPPTREGSGTKSSGRRPKYRASFQVSLQYVRRWYVFLGPYLQMFWVFGSLHLPAVTSAIPGLNSDLDVRYPPVVTSASEVLTQTYLSSGLVQWLACWAQNPKVREEQSYMNACRIVRQCRTWTCPFPESGGIQLTLQERISERIVVLFVVVQFLRFKNKLWKSCFYSQERIQQRTGTDCLLSRTTGGGRNCGRDSLRIGGWWFAPKSTVLS